VPCGSTAYVRRSWPSLSRDSRGWGGTGHRSREGSPPRAVLWAG